MLEVTLGAWAMAVARDEAMVVALGRAVAWEKGEAMAKGNIHHIRRKR